MTMFKSTAVDFALAGGVIPLDAMQEIIDQGYIAQQHGPLRPSAIPLSHVTEWIAEKLPPARDDDFVPLGYTILFMHPTGGNDRDGYAMEHARAIVDVWQVGSEDGIGDLTDWVIQAADNVTSVCWSADLRALDEEASHSALMALKNALKGAAAVKGSLLRPSTAYMGWRNQDGVAVPASWCLVSEDAVSFVIARVDDGDVIVRPDDLEKTGEAAEATKTGAETSGEDGNVPTKAAAEVDNGEHKGDETAIPAHAAPAAPLVLGAANDPTQHNFPCIVPNCNLRTRPHMSRRTDLMDHLRSEHRCALAKLRGGNQKAHNLQQNGVMRDWMAANGIEWRGTIFADGA
ncbi:hypothetical protein LTR53_003037 [Teratosphaeriaceae sp. CCFEE 6253]|nr:hypothetical protein LTR53_003037 [Teratosphaeriaceae sp. CCFEE 6253]